MDLCDRIQVDDNVKLPPREYKYVWKNIILYIYLVSASCYGLYLGVTSAKWTSLLFAVFMICAGNLGITCGVHRLWSHRSYKARTPLKVFLVILQTLAFQMSVIEWSRDHRLHHKYSETDADPHNAKRGFFFSHVGWLLVRKHPDVITKGKGIDISDLTEDKVLRFQKDNYFAMVLLITFLIPTAIPMYFWNETFMNASTLNLLRYCLALNITWMVNSVAHMFGNKPYDKFINPVENKAVSFLALGEGWHNYHHTFPWDYRTGEYDRLNWTCRFIDFMAKIGQAYDLKSVSMDMIKKRCERTGDGTHEVWGWGDKDQTPEEIVEATITYQKTDKDD